MAYCSETQLLAVMPTDILTALLDDNGDGTADAGVLTAAQAQVDTDIDAILIGAGVPLDTTPKIVTSAAPYLLAEVLFDRRHAGEKNPYRPVCDKIRERLRAAGGKTVVSADQHDPYTPPDGDEDYDASLFSDAQQEGVL